MNISYVIRIRTPHTNGYTAPRTFNLGAAQDFLSSSYEESLENGTFIETAIWVANSKHAEMSPLFVKFNVEDESGKLHYFNYRAEDSDGQTRFYFTSAVRIKEGPFIRP